MGCGLVDIVNLSDKIEYSDELTLFQLKRDKKKQNRFLESEVFCLMGNHFE
jgi:hypothetical protein